ncbi:MAG: Cof-type HAD-IIB family hydrolase [Clostridiales bacterium]|nr:Cof-type HAD-IIB family hydrolase [Clostridiales bacterium]
MKEIKLIATDLDGTFLDNSKQISAENLKAVHDAVNKGVLFVPATGRALHTMPDNVLALDCVDYAVTSNGAAVVEMKTGNIIYKNQLDNAMARRVIEYAAEINVMAEIFVNGRAYTLKKYMDNLIAYGVNPKFEQWYRDTRNVVDNYEIVLGNNVSVENINIIFADMAQRVEAFDCLSKNYDVEITNSIGNNLETGAKGCSKGVAIEALAEYLGIDMENVMCFGDNYNDLDMIKRAGIGVAVANGEDFVKEQADFTAKSNNDNGFAEAVYKFVINREE